MRKIKLTIQAYVLENGRYHPYLIKKCKKLPQRLYTGQPLRGEPFRPEHRGAIITKTYYKLTDKITYVYIEATKDGDKDKIVEE